MAAGEPQIKEGRCNISLRTRAYYHIPIHDYVISTTSIYKQVANFTNSEPKIYSFSHIFPIFPTTYWMILRSPMSTEKTTAGHLGNVPPKSLHQRAHLLKGRGNRIEDLVTNEGFFLLERIGS